VRRVTLADIRRLGKQKAPLLSHVSAKVIEKIYKNIELSWDFAPGHLFAGLVPLPGCSLRGRQHAWMHREGEGRGRHHALPGIPNTERPRLLTLLQELTRPVIRKSRETAAVQAQPPASDPAARRAHPQAPLQHTEVFTPSKGEVTNKNCFYLSILFEKQAPLPPLLFSSLPVCCCTSPRLGPRTAGDRGSLCSAAAQVDGSPPCVLSAPPHAICTEKFRK